MEKSFKSLQTPLVMVLVYSTALLEEALLWNIFHLQKTTDSTHEAILSERKTLWILSFEKVSS